MSETCETGVARDQQAYQGNREGMKPCFERGCQGSLPMENPSLCSKSPTLFVVMGAGELCLEDPHPTSAYAGREDHPAEKPHKAFFTG